MDDGELNDRRLDEGGLRYVSLLHQFAQVQRSAFSRRNEQVVVSDVLHKHLVACINVRFRDLELLLQDDFENFLLREIFSIVFRVELLEDLWRDKSSSDISVPYRFIG